MTDDVEEGWVTIRDALRGLVLLWLAAVAVATSIQIATFSPWSLPVSAAVALIGVAIAVAAGYGSLRAFGLLA